MMASEGVYDVLPSSGREKRISKFLLLPVLVLLVSFVFADATFSFFCCRGGSGVTADATDAAEAFAV